MYSVGLGLAEHLFMYFTVFSGVYPTGHAAFQERCEPIQPRSWTHVSLHPSPGAVLTVHIRV